MCIRDRYRTWPTASRRPIFEFPSTKGITRVQTSRNVDISRHSNGTYFGIGWCYSHMVGYAGSPTYTAYVDMTLTRSKVKVTDHLNFWQLPINVHFHVYLLRHFCDELKTDGWYWQYGTWSTDSRRPLFEFPSRKGINRECRYFTTFKWPHISVLGDATVTWLGMLVVLHILRMLIWPWPDPRSRSLGFWTSDN